MRRFHRLVARRPEPADRELARVLVEKLFSAKDESLRSGVGRLVEHDGAVIANIEVVDDAPDEWGSRHRTAFVHLARSARELVPIPWRG